MKEILIDLKQLKQPAEPLKFMTDVGINKEEGTTIINELKEVLASRSDLIALCAPQIGINKRIICIKFDNEIKTFINPIIKKKTAKEDVIVRIETNPCLPNKEIAICRPKEVDIVYNTEKFKYEDNKLLGAAAAVFMQQYEMLDGILPTETLSLLSQDKHITELDLLYIIAGEYSGGGIVVDVANEDDHLSVDDLGQLADILNRQRLIFSKIGTTILDEKDEVLSPIYKNLKYLERVCTGEIIPVTEDKAAKIKHAKTKKFDRQLDLKNFLRRKK